MTLVKFNNRNRLFPWNIAGLPSLSTDEFFNDDFFAEESLMPAMNIKDKKNDFEIEFAAPGFNKKDFEVTIDDNVLHVSGEKSQEQVENEEDFTRKEFNADVMHEASIKWLSELRFIKDEEQFFEDLIKLFTLKLIDPENFPNTQEIVTEITKLRKRNKVLIDSIIRHEKELKIMVDGINQIKEEEAYKDVHRELFIAVKKYFKEYRLLKTRLFKTLKEVMKHEKQKN